MRDLPAFLPYGLGRAFAVRGLGRVTAPVRVGVRLDTAELPADAVSRSLAALFRYDETAGRWQALDTWRSAGEETLALSAETEGASLFAVTLSTHSETGNDEQPWQPTVGQLLAVALRLVACMGPWPCRQFGPISINLTNHYIFPQKPFGGNSHPSEVKKLQK
ncbi:MAG: hypothetical protein ACPLYD_10490 [Anaerolineae bacterium]|jgi:hypothetical protein